MGMGEGKGSVFTTLGQKSGSWALENNISGKILTVCERQVHVIFPSSQLEFVFLFPRINKVIKISTGFSSLIN